MLRRALLACLLCAFAASAEAQTVRRIRGTVESLDGSTLMVRTREGDQARIQLAPNYTVTSVVPARIEDARAGTYIGAAATGPRDKLRAIEVLIFPEALRGSGEGHYPWDLAPESTMTNATVEAESAGTNGRTLTLVAKGERLAVTVPSDAPVVTFAAGSPTMLVPGAKVFIGAQAAADGTLTAARVAVGKDGLTPPM